MWIDKDGYVRLYKPNSYDKSYYVHRLIYEKYYKCCLLPTTIVHHIDGIKLNNNPLNLHATTRENHASIHHKYDKSNWICTKCNGKTRKHKEHEYWYYINGERICDNCYKNSRYDPKKRRLKYLTSNRKDRNNSQSQRYRY